MNYKYKKKNFLRVLRYNTIHKDSLRIVGFVAYLSPMDIKRSYHEFTMIKPKKQQTDFRFTQQGNEHDKDNIILHIYVSHPYSTTEPNVPLLKN